MATKSEYVILRMLPGDAKMIVAKTGLENVKDAKIEAQDLAMTNPEVVFVPAVLYDVAYAKEIRNTQITEAPDNVMRLLGFANLDGSAKVMPADDPGNNDSGDDNSRESGSKNDTEESGSGTEGTEPDAVPDAVPDAAPATVDQSSGELF